MFNPDTKFEVPSIFCNEKIKSNAEMPNVEILVLSHPLGDLRVTHRVHLWLDGNRIVDLLLVISELFSLALKAKALLNEICRNRHFLKGWASECEF